MIPAARTGTTAVTQYRIINNSCGTPLQVSIPVPSQQDPLQAHREPHSQPVHALCNGIHQRGIRLRQMARLGRGNIHPSNKEQAPTTITKHCNHGPLRNLRLKEHAPGTIKHQCHTPVKRASCHSRSHLQHNHCILQGRGGMIVAKHTRWEHTVSLSQHENRWRNRLLLSHSRECCTLVRRKTIAIPHKHWNHTMRAVRTAGGAPSRPLATILPAS